jgi:hypothetical protein
MPVVMPFGRDLRLGLSVVGGPPPPPRTRTRVGGLLAGVSFSDHRRGTYVVDAAENDAEVQKLISVGTKQARRGRPSKSQS